ncbi:alpha-amylase family protein [Actinomyces vulturis]|uniref:alpha-amylase family protein n=1 Tax=Actinomyces vulturis TaxID=1857645 RepID=UPI00083692A3|nr:alpha-amylase family protein [Actinomyces vulturis]
MDRVTIADDSYDSTTLSLFTARCEHFGPDLHDALVKLYGPEANQQEEALLEMAWNAYQERSPELQARDIRRQLNPTWLTSNEHVGYAAYTERFAGSLPEVSTRIDYLKELGVTYLHLMPLLQPREGDNDGGYAVADYTTVRPDLGTIEDLAALASALHDNGINLVMDLVLNHVAQEHEWARKARQGDERYRNYFYIYPDRTMPDAFEETLPEVFPDFAPGNFTWVDECQSWVWTTFNSFQWDVNWSNPAVMREYVAIIFRLANLGVDVLRLDAIAFMGKRLGTTCQNQPEVHAITRVLRALTSIACPALALKAEAIVGPKELVHYLGTGANEGKLSHIAYHNTLMVQIWSMLASADVRLAAHVLRDLPPTPLGSTWITYIRCHDDIGWAIDDSHAAAVGLSGPAHREFLSDYYSGAYPTSRARGLIFQHNPVTNDSRISGTAAALIGLTDAEEHHLAAASRYSELTGWKCGQDPDERAAILATNPPEMAGINEEVRLAAMSTGITMEERLRALFLANAMIYGWGGIPVIWSGDELGQANDSSWHDDPAHRADNRWAGRPVLDAERIAQLGNIEQVPGRVYADLARLARTRASLPILDGRWPTSVEETEDPAILIVVRTSHTESLIEIYNVSNREAAIPAWRLAELGVHHECASSDHQGIWVIDLLSGESHEPGVDGNYRIRPYGAWWLKGN